MKQVTTLMRLNCPSCSLAYDVPDAMLVRPRSLRCSQCGHTWLTESVAPTVVEPVAVPADLPPEPMAPLAIEPEEPIPQIAAASLDDEPLLPRSELDLPGFADPGPPGTDHEQPEMPAPEPTTIAAPIATNDLDDVPRLRMVPPPPRKQRAQAVVLGAWAASIAILVLAGWGAYSFRGPVMAAWPPSERVYAGLGLAS